MHRLTGQSIDRSNRFEVQLLHSLSPSQEHVVTSVYRCLSLVAGLILMAACGSAAAPASQPGAPQVDAPAADALLQVIAPTGTQGFSLSDLQKLPATTIMVDGKPQDGPAVLDVLKAAGVADFKEITLSGAGTLTLSKDQVTAEVILDFTNRGTVKFAAASVPQANWPKDITRIEVK
jgi:hypothetical protein